MYNIKIINKNNDVTFLNGIGYTGEIYHSFSMKMPFTRTQAIRCKKYLNTVPWIKTIELIKAEKDNNIKYMVDCINNQNLCIAEEMEEKTI